MVRNKLLAVLVSVVIAVIVAAAGIALAQPPRNVSAARHPDLAKAQQLSRQAWQQVVDAQVANEWDMGGHAQKARELLDQANSELKLAADAANAKAPRT